MKFKVCMCVFGVLLAVAMVFGVASRMNWKNRLNEGADEAAVAFFQKDYQDLLVGIEEGLLEESRMILEVEATGEREYVYGNLKQGIEIRRVVKGKKRDFKKRKTYLVGAGRVEEGNTFNDKPYDMVVGLGYVNYMQKGNRYLVFADKCFSDYNKKATMIEATEASVGLRYLNISRNESYIYETTLNQTEYKNVKDSEFFANDKETLEKMLAAKKRILNKLGYDV